MTPERLEELMVKVVDRVATPAEEEELMSYLVDHPQLRRELEQHLALKAVTDGWVQRLEADLAEDQHRASPLTLAEQGLGLALVLVSVALLAGGGMTALFFDAEAPLWLKIGFGLGGAGTLVLLFSVIRWRLSVRQRDPYTEVIR